jgi:hypothetical protein
MKNVNKNTNEVTIVQLTRPGVMATFTHYRNGYLYYNIKIENGDVYRVVLDSTEFKECNLEAHCNASLFRRWIREAMIKGELNKVV